MSQAPEEAVVPGEDGRTVMFDCEVGSQRKAVVMAPVKRSKRSSYRYRKDCKGRERAEKQTGEWQEGRTEGGTSPRSMTL